MKNAAITHTDCYHLHGPIHITWRESGDEYWLCDIYAGPPHPDHYNYVTSTTAHPTEELALAAGETLRNTLMEAARAS